MININDELFDNKIKERIKNEINSVPDDVNEKINNAVKNVRKRRVKLKNICSICAICIVGTMLFGMAMPTYASNIPIIGSIFEMFNYKTFENYDKYASDLNISKESNGLKMTINKVVYDEIELSIFYTVESQKKLEAEPRFPDEELKINGKETTFGGGGTGKFSNDNKTYIGVMEYNTGKKNLVPKDIQNKMFLGGYVEIPDKFILSLNIDEILSSGDNVIKGKWNFDIPVTSEKVSGKINEENCDIDLSELVSGYHINKIITTPLNTSIQGTINGENSEDRVLFNVFDNKGRNIPFKGSGGSGYKDVMYISSQFKEVYEDTESLTFIPYKHKYDRVDNSDNNSEKYIKTKLNLQGETKLFSKDGNEYVNITRVNTENGKTKIYYKSKYGSHVAPIEIVNNETGEKILTIDNSNDRRHQEENISYLKDSDEYVITCDKELKGEDFSIKYVDISKNIEVYNDYKFTIKIK